MRTLLLAAAGIHAVLIALMLRNGPVDVMVLAGIGVVATLVTGVMILTRDGAIGTVWVGTVAGLAALAGLGSWLLLWFLDPERTGAVINITGILAPGLAVLLYLLAALLPGRRRRA